MEIHRCRFVPYPPSAINVVAFSHQYLKNEKKTRSEGPLVRLAIGRANGDIEIWNPLKGSWVQEQVIRGGKDRSIDGLVWTQDPDEEINKQTIKGKLRLFSIGYTTTVTEWNLSTGEPLRHSSGNHGEIWCIAAQPPMSITQRKKAEGWKGQDLVTGCTDGGIVLYSTKDETLALQRILAKPSARKAKIISIAFQNRNVVVAGCSDSTIRLFDASKGTNIRNMSLGSGPSGGPKEIIVWAVKCLPNGNIVSGDSTGEIRIWDGRTHTLMQRLKSHTEDVLSLATSHDGTTIFSGGMDMKTVVHKLSESGRSRWMKTKHQRQHEHDVKSMAAYEDANTSVVVSGGVDATPIITPLREFGLENYRKLPFLPQSQPVASAPSKRLVMSYWDRELSIWRINKPRNEDLDMYFAENEPETRARKLVARILLKGEASINSASISRDGSLLAISTNSEIKVFHLRQRKSYETDALKVTKISAPSSFESAGARLVEFSPDGKWLCIVRNDSRISLARIQASQTSSPPRIFNTLTKLERLDRKQKKFRLLGGLGTYARTISKIAFSSDSRILAVGDLAGYIDTWILEGTEDETQEFLDDDSDSDSDSSSDDDSDVSSDDTEKEKGTIIYGQRWITNPSARLIPKVKSCPVVLSFRPSDKKSKALKSLANGGSIPHPTRHTPNPVSHSPETLPTEDRLLVVTATSQIFEFEVLKGELSAWSRRNPTEKFPLAFRNLRDLAMGAVWDIKADRERLWLYGISWLWMFDLSEDFTPEATESESDEVIMQVEEEESSDTNERKRKRVSKGDPTIRAKKLKLGTSGAGSRVPDEELQTGIGRKILKIQYEEDEEENDLAQVEEFDVKRPTMGKVMEDEGDDDEGEGDGESDDDGDIEMGGIRDEVDGPAEDEEVRGNGNGREISKPEAKSWSTLKYRPILGLVEISGGDKTNRNGGMEVVIVERPLLETELPPRFDSGKKWHRPGLE